MSSVTVSDCPQNTPNLACLRIVSSRPSDQQQKKPDGRTCWAGSVERQLYIHFFRHFCCRITDVSFSHIVQRHRQTDRQTDDIM